MAKLYQVVALHYPDLEPDYSGPALSIEDQIAGVQRVWPVVYDSRAEATETMARLRGKPDPSFNGTGEALWVEEIDG